MAPQCIKSDVVEHACKPPTSQHHQPAANKDLEASGLPVAETNDCEEEKAKKRPSDDGRNLDSGYAWLILAVMFLLASSTGGTNRVYGLIYAKQVAIGYYDHEEASWPIATASTVENLAGLMTPALAQFLTWRQIELLATLLFVAANVGAYFSDSLALDILCLGIIQGLALSINTVLSLVINNDYFKRYRTTVYGISLSGSTFGILYLGPIVSWCLDQHELEFRSGYLAIGCVLALNALLVIFIKPRHETLKRPTVKGGQSNGYDDHDDNQDNEKRLDALGRKRSLLERHLERKNSVASIALMCKQKRQSQLQRQPTGRLRCSLISIKDPAEYGGAQTGRTTRQPQELLVGQLGVQDNAGLRKSFSSSVEQQIKRNSMSIFSAPSQAQEPAGGHLRANMVTSVNASIRADKQTAKEEKKKDSAAFPLFHTNLSPAESLSNRSGACNQQLEPRHDDDDNDNYNDEDDTDINHENEHKANKITDSETETKTTTEREDEEGLSAQLVGALLRSPYLHCVWIMLSLYYLIARIFIIILVDLAKDNGLSSGESRALLNYWSVGEIVGRIILCSFVDLQWLSVRACILLTCTSMSVCIGLMALLAGSFYLYAICAALIAALISLEYVLINVLMIEYLGQARVTSCYSLGSFISSLALLGRPALIGLFRDQLGSYNGLLLLLAGLSLAFGLLFGLTEPLLARYWPKGQLFHRSQLLLSPASSSGSSSGRPH